MEEDVVTATGLAPATIANLIERPEPAPKGEVARLLAESAAPDGPGQRDILLRWARLLERTRTHHAPGRQGPP